MHINMIGKISPKALLGASVALSLGLMAFAPVSLAGEHHGDHHNSQHQHHQAHQATADIVDTAVAAGKFNTLAVALKAAGLVDVLKSDGKFTVFAPTDEAFAALPEGTLATLLKPENKEKLANILKYHVVAGAVEANEVVLKDSVKPLYGKSLTINTNNGVFVENAQVVKADVHASNGIIHVIDKVMLPE
ncbi:MAG: fasciclin domain-containing protein [Vampirovibrio sp.]|nr:fasciclin domain-containing protein [Vampirovibrio sp.]